MNYSKSKKSIIAFSLAGLLFFSNMLPLLAVEKKLSNEILIEKIDSTKAKNPEHHIKNSTVDKDIQSKSKTSSNLTYNLIYYLISMFLKTNPLSRPK